MYFLYQTLYSQIFQKLHNYICVIGDNCRNNFRCISYVSLYEVQISLARYKMCLRATVTSEKWRCFVFLLTLFCIGNKTTTWHHHNGGTSLFAKFDDETAKYKRVVINYIKEWGEKPTWIPLHYAHTSLIMRLILD